MYSEKATKIWQNLQTCLNAATKIQIKIGDFIKFISFIRIYELYMIEKLLEAQALIMLLQKWFPPIMNPSHVFWSISRHVRSLDTLSLTYIDLVRLLFSISFPRPIYNINFDPDKNTTGRIYLHCVSYY